MKRMQIIALSVLLFAVPRGAWAEWRVQLLSHVAPGVGAPTIRDVVDEAKTSAAFLEQFGKVVVTLPKEEHAVTVAPVLAALSRAGVDLGNLVVRPASSDVEISRADPEILSMVRTLVVKQLATALQMPADQFVIEWTDYPPQLPERTLFTQMTVNPVATPDQPHSYRVHVNFIQGQDQTIAVADFGARLRYRQHLLTATRPLMAGAIIGNEDFRDDVQVVDAPEQFVNSFDDVKGQKMQLVEGLADGAALTRANLRLTSQLQKGAIVTIYANDPRFRVRALGRVKEVTDNGASVVVENLDSKKELTGRPVGANEVQIVF